MKKNYYELARKFHPDRVATNEKEGAQEKFNIIHTAYSILSDATKKKLYDDGSCVIFTKATVAAHWENNLKPVNSSDIDSARKRYQGSIEEKNDFIREFTTSNGSMTHLLNNIPFMRIEDQMRMIKIIRDLMDNGEIATIPIRKIRK